MKKFNSKSVGVLALSASVIALIIAGPVSAQDAQEPDASQPSGVSGDPQDEGPVSISSDGSATSEEAGRITVTGSRIQRDTYTSISPLQVLSTEASRDVGVFDPAQILQRSESAAGTQIDATFQGFVLNNGPGSQTLDLRGLGAERTLLLVNGRRLAPAGVEGAPTNPSINLLPGSLIERYDLLLDGASSVYGSDAVAGVGNIILRKDFDGLELFGRGDLNEQGGGNDYTVSGSWGMNSDRGFFGIGAEYDYRDTIRLKNRDFFSGCNTHREITDTGEVRTIGLADNAAVEARTPGVSVSESECKITGISGRIFIPQSRLGSVYFQPGRGNSGLPDFSESTNAFNVDLDSNNDGLRDVDFQDINTNAANLDQVFLSKQKLYNVMAYGEYTLAGDANITPFFEANYSRAEIFADNTGTPQLFPFVPGLNAFNPCNFVSNPNGVDCRQADNDTQGLITGVPPALSVGRLLAVEPITSIRGDRNNTDVTQQQYRLVLGVKGDLPFIGQSWKFETAGVYSRSKGNSIRRGIREDKLAFALGIDPTADFNGDGVFDNTGDGLADDYDLNAQFDNTVGSNGSSIGPCNAAGLSNPGAAMSDLLQGCVPVNLFAPSVLTGAIGDFASQAERDYLFDERVFNTTYQQTTLNAFVTGDVIDLPAGPVGVVLGAEYRKDKINSRPDEIASNGLFFGFFSDQGAVGSKYIVEAFGEVDIPLLADKPLVRELNLNLSGRITEEEFYGTNGTYSVKAGWRPVDPLLFRFSYGTSFRAPNLRENFLLGQSGFLTLFDPCAVPTEAFVGGAYDPSLENREQVVLDNCIREGRDPTRAGIDAQGLNTFQTSSVEISTGGSLDINPEKSRSITAGFAFEETFGAGWDVSFGFNYYDIEISNSIVEPSSQFIINDCYTRDDGQRSPFCDRIEVDSDPNTRLLVSGVNSGFINLNEESVRGIDLNATFGKDVMLFGKSVDLGLNLRANHLIERSTLFIDDNGEETFDDDAGEFGLPKWTGRATFTAQVDNWRFTWETRYVGPVEQDDTGIDVLSDAFGRGPDGLPAGVVGDTCLGNGSGSVVGGVFVSNGLVPGDGVFCRDVGFAGDYFLHTVSVRYSADTWNARIGVTNLFDRSPPLVDSSEVLAIANTAIGNGYDYDGRQFFISLEKAF